MNALQLFSTDQQASSPLGSTLRLSACCAAVLLMALPANATNSQDKTYLSGHLGAAMLQDSDIGSSSGSNLSVDMNLGMGMGMAVGRSFGNTRLEGELNYQTNDLDTVRLSGGGKSDCSGDVSSWSLMVNGYYDFKGSGPVSSFLLAGVGFARVEVDGFNVPGSGVADMSGDDTVLAYQLGAGIGYAISEELTLDLSYRYFATTDPSFNGIDVEYSSHNLYLGLRLAL
nr:outer membrane beta-barrel protein [uncultured Desulfobulbus sp.]